MWAALSSLLLLSLALAFVLILHRRKEAKTAAALLRAGAKGAAKQTYRNEGLGMQSPHQFHTSNGSASLC